MMSSTVDYNASRKRATRQHSAEEQALSQVAKEGEHRSAVRRAARAEAREIRSRELERQQREQEEREKADKLNELKRDFTTSSHFGSSTSSSRRSSNDSTEDVRDLRRELSQLEDKYKKSMVTNAQLDNEKQALRYEVDLLKDQVEEMEELLVETQRELKDRVRELDLKKRDFVNLEQKCEAYKEQLSQRDALIQEHGLLFVTDETMDDSTDGAPVDRRKTYHMGSSNAALLSPSSLSVLSSYSGSLDDRLLKIVDEKKTLEREIRKLKQELEDERERRTVVDKYKSHSPGPNALSNGPTESQQASEVQADLQRQINDYKFKLKRAEQDVTTLEGNVIRLESQVKRFKTAADNAEKVEEELKGEKRKFQKELREVQAQKQELELENGHLQKRLEKLQKTRPNAK